MNFFRKFSNIKCERLLFGQKNLIVRDFAEGLYWNQICSNALSHSSDSTNKSKAHATMPLCMICYGQIDNDNAIFVLKTQKRDSNSMDTYIRRQRFWSQTSNGEQKRKQITRCLHLHRWLIPTRIILIFIAKLCDSDRMPVDRQFVRKWNGILKKCIRLLNGQTNRNDKQ